MFDHSPWGRMVEKTPKAPNLNHHGPKGCVTSTHIPLVTISHFALPWYKGDWVISLDMSPTK